MSNIEIEVRTFISKEKHEELLDFFKENAKLIKEDYQETYYFDCEEDLRIQKNNFFAKAWLKKGNIHDPYREEIEIKIERDRFEDLEDLFLALGYKVEIKWFRKRFQFDWENINVFLDYSKGYGYIIELEKISSDKDKSEIYNQLRKKLVSLGIDITSKKEFNERYLNYKENWEDLI